MRQGTKPDTEQTPTATAAITGLSTASVTRKSPTVSAEWTSREKPYCQ